jgi:hypothetical protein
MGQIGSARKNIFYLLLSLFFLLAFLEEISWGQRILGIETPDLIAKVNRQNEINIHNLTWFHGNDETGNRRKPFLQLFLNGDRLYSFFWFGYCVCIPLLGKYYQSAKKVFDKIRLPIVPVHYAFMFSLNYSIAKVGETMCPAYRHSLVETKETVIAMLFACVAFGQIYRLWMKPSVVSTSIRSTS